MRIVRDALPAEHQSPPPFSIHVAANIISKIVNQDPSLPSLLRNIPTINGQPLFELPPAIGGQGRASTTPGISSPVYDNHSYRSLFNNGSGNLCRFSGPRPAPGNANHAGHLVLLSLTTTGLKFA